MPQYMLLIYSEPGSWEALSEDERNSIYQEYFTLSDEMRDRGVRGAHELGETRTAKTVRVRGSERLVTDGAAPPETSPP